MVEPTAPLQLALVGELDGGKSVLARRLNTWLRLSPLKEWPAVIVLDTAGLRAQSGATLAERQGHAGTLAACAEATLLLHVLDASRPALYQPHADLSPLDAALVRWGRTRRGYVAVATKMDRPGARAGLLTLRRCLDGLPLVAVSSLCGTGWLDLRGSLRQVALGR